MNQNEAVVDNDLQKAIDDITKTTNQDPVFSDPVAAPSSVPEGDTGELAESVGPFPTPKPMPTPPKPPVQPVTPNFATTPPVTPMPDLTPIEPEPPVPPVQIETTETVVKTDTPANIHEVKTAALRDLAPLVGKMNLPASQKFGIYKDMFESLHDHTVIEPAYQAAKNISDDHERGEALLYLIESIDNM